MSFVIVVLLIVLVAALLAYAIVPVIDLLHRVMPARWPLCSSMCWPPWSLG